MTRITKGEYDSITKRKQEKKESQRKNVQRKNRKYKTTEELLTTTEFVVQTKREIMSNQEHQTTTAKNELQTITTENDLTTMRISYEPQVTTHKIFHERIDKLGQVQMCHVCQSHIMEFMWLIPIEGQCV